MQRLFVAAIVLGVAWLLVRQMNAAQSPALTGAPPFVIRATFGNCVSSGDGNFMATTDDPACGYFIGNGRKLGAGGAGGNGSGVTQWWTT